MESTQLPKGSNQVVLTVRKVEALRARSGDERTEYWDVRLKGFGLRVASSGRKTFTVRYVVRGFRRRKDLGVYGVTTTYLEARTEAERIISEARNGRDPEMSTMLLKRNNISDFHGLCDAYMEQRLPELRPATQQGMGRIIRKELVPVWGARDPQSIQPEEVDDWAHRLARRAPYLANRSFDYMSVIYGWAIKRRMLRYTPFIGLTKPHREEARTRVFDNAELSSIFDALRQAPPQTSAIWLMLFYTGNRLREVLRMEWAWINIEEQYLLLPAAVTKNKREHVVPLVTPAMELLLELRRQSAGSPYVFPGPKGKPLNWVQKAAERLLAAAQIKDGRHHDIRRTMATAMAKDGIEPSIIDMTLNHVPPGQKLHRVYNTYNYIPEKRAALERWVARLMTVLGGEPNSVMLARRQPDELARTAGRKATPTVA